MIQCHNLIKSFGRNDVIRGVSLQISNRKITSLIGRNGAGKSTLIGLIMDYYRCDSGEVKKGTVSVMPDADNMYSDWTGLEFLKFIARLKKTDVSYAVNLSKELGLYKNLKGKISGYSFGMKKKLSFIQCAIGDFDAYIFDEPTSGVDVPSALIMMDIIKRLKATGAAILLTSHNIDELERVSDYLYIIENGKIIQKGTVDDIINREKQLVYYLVSSQADAISKSDAIKKYIQSIHENNLELLFSDEQEAVDILRQLTVSYPIVEFYQKKKSLIESVYE